MCQSTEEKGTLNPILWVTHPAGAAAAAARSPWTVAQGQVHLAWKQNPQGMGTPRASATVRHQGGMALGTDHHFPCFHCYGFFVIGDVAYALFFKTSKQHTGTQLGVLSRAGWRGRNLLFAGLGGFIISFPSKEKVNFSLKLKEISNHLMLSFDILHV